MLEFVGIGDVHGDKLEKILPGVGNKWICREVRKPLNYALKKGIKHAFFYGDIGEYARWSYEFQMEFKNVLLDPKYKDLNQWLILGNHDWDEKGRHSLEVLVNDLSLFKAHGLKLKIKVLTDLTDVEIDGVPVRFLPYPHTKTTGKALNVGHFEVAGSTRDNGRKIKDGVETNHLCVLGHLHTCHRVGNSFYSGTLYQTNFGEYLPKSFHHVKVKDNLKHKVMNVPNDPEYKLLNVEVHSRKDLDQISDNPKVLHKLFVQDGMTIDPRDLEERPNVVKVNRFKDDKDLKTQLEEEWKIEDVGNVFQPEEDVERFLSERKVEDKVKTRALKIHRRFLKKVVENGTE